MEMNKAITKAKEKAEDLIRDITKKEHISPAELEALMKSACLIMKVEGGDAGNGNDYEDSYSERGMSRNSYNHMYDPMDYAEASYRRGRSPVTGQYVSRDGGSGTSNRGYYDGGGNSSSRRYYDGGNSSRGYSGHSIQDRMIAKLEDMYDEAHTEHERQVVQDWINRLSR